MAFARRKQPLVIGAEPVYEIEALEAGVSRLVIGLQPTVDAEVSMEEFGRCRVRLRNRDVFCKLVFRMAP